MIARDDQAVKYVADAESGGWFECYGRAILVRESSLILALSRANSEAIEP